jgi:hypothetical protein
VGLVDVVREVGGHLASGAEAGVQGVVGVVGATAKSKPTPLLVNPAATGLPSAWMSSALAWSWLTATSVVTLPSVPKLRSKVPSGL